MLDDSGLAWLENWFLEQCDGSWEHDNGVTIESLDNPGWELKVQVEGTYLADVPFGKVTDLREGDEWMSCEVKNGQFYAACGPRQLRQAIEVFRQWATHGRPDPSSTPSNR